MNLQQKQDLFMASISHELRTPLTSILGYGELLNNTHLDSKQQEYLKRMLHSSKYLLSLVGDFLDIVKFQNNEIDLDLKEIRLHTVLSECAEIIKTNLHKDIKFETDIPFLNYTILADDRRIKQVMLNLLSNAAKFTKSGTIKFYVKDIIELDNETKLTVNIEDSGMGMSEEIQKALFNPFVTGDSTQGFGLGLYISQEIIRLMKGEIKVTSQEGKGSTFSVTFLVNKIKNKNISQILFKKNILMFSNQSVFNQNITDALKTFNSTLQCYSPNQNIASSFRTIFASTLEYHIAVFDMNHVNYDVAPMISTLKMLHPSIKCIALLKQYSSVRTSYFDKIVQTPISVENLMYEFEELSAIDNNLKKNNQYIDFSHLHVLIVEDVEMSRDYIKEMFSISFSIECDTAVNGKDAIEKVKQTNYDIIFMDVRMPILNGLKATKEIRKFNQNVPIICMSADVHDKDIHAAKDAGMNSFIQKPLDKGEIIECLLSLIPQGTAYTVSHTVSLKEIAHKYLAQNFNEETILLLLEKSSQSIALYIGNIKEHSKTNNYQSLADDFHAFKGLLGNLGLTDEAKTTSELQHTFEDEDSSYDVEEKVTSFLEKMEIFLNDIT